VSAVRRLQPTAERDPIADVAARLELEPLGDRDFGRLRDLIYREAGIFLSDIKRALVVGRLAKHLRRLGLTSFAAYYDVVSDSALERERMLDAICTNETQFFREPQHFAFLMEAVLPRWREEARAGTRPRRARVWSAGCSTGEEPYSLAMLLKDELDGWDIDILATDLSTYALGRARAGLFAIERAQHIPPAYLKRYMLRGHGSQLGRMSAGDEIRGHIRFAQLNLNDASYQVPGRFDLIFCRNVLIYFDHASRSRVVQRLLERLEPTGYFFLGHAETLNGITTNLRHAIPTVYTSMPNSGRRAGKA
jgi:chemotaxis protein methyltransferase CheR